MKRNLFILLLLFVGLCKVNAQNAEEVEVEGSADSIVMMPGDDEDLEVEASAIGDGKKQLTTVVTIDIDEPELTEVTPPGPTEMGEDDNEMPDEPEITNTSPPTKKPDGIGKAVVVEPDMEVDEPDASPEDSKFSETADGKEEPEPDVETDLEADNGNVDVKSGETTSMLANTQFLAALIVGGCVGILFAVCVILLLAYRMRKKDEGSYALDEQKKPSSPNAYQYTQGQEYYA